MYNDHREHNRSFTVQLPLAFNELPLTPGETPRLQEAPVVSEEQAWDLLETMIRKYRWFNWD